MEEKWTWSSSKSSQSTGILHHSQNASTGDRDKNKNATIQIPRKKFDKYKVITKIICRLITQTMDGRWGLLAV